MLLKKSVIIEKSYVQNDLLFGKPVLVHLCFKCLKITISKNYALKTGFSKGLIFEDLWI